MTSGEAIAIGAACLSLVTSIVAPAIIVGRFLGSILTTQATHTREIEHLQAGMRDKGVRLEELGKDLARLEGRLEGEARVIEAVESALSRGHRAG